MTEKNSIRFNAEIVNGQCPSCSEVTMLVSVATDYYRCVTCGTDLQQHINGKISYYLFYHQIKITNYMLRIG